MICIFGKENKAFTLIELVIVISIIGILVLLATPKFIAHTKEAKLAQIKHDVKAVETVIDEYLIRNKALPEDLSVFDYSKSLEENKVYGKTGLITQLEGEFLDVTDMKEVKAINSKLKGNFIANNNGDVYYVATERIIEVDGGDENGNGESNEKNGVFIPKEWLNEDYVKIEAGGYRSFLMGLNEIYGFGYNEYGQLGLGNKTSRNTPAEIEELKDKDIIKILVGVDHNYAISSNGDVYVFGKNNLGQLGLGDTTNILTPVKNNTLSEFTSKNIKTVGDHSLLVENGKLYSWGRNDFGQLGLGDTTQRLTPTEVSYFTQNNLTIKDAWAGHSHSFAITTDNRLYAWGKNDYRQLGLGDTTNRLNPTEVTFFTGIPIKDIKTNDNSTFVLTEDGKVYSFGYSLNGRLGRGYVMNPNPEIVNIGDEVIEQIVTGRSSTIVRTKSGNIYGWGSNFSKELGFSGMSDIPKRLTAIENLNPVDIKMGNFHTIIRTNTGDVYVLGSNSSGELGLGDKTDRSTPTKLDISFITTGNEANTEYPKVRAFGHSSFLIYEDKVYGFGDNSYRQIIFDPSNTVSSTPPVEIDFFRNRGIVDILSYWESFHAIDKDGNVYSWGSNSYGQLGLGHRGEITTPVKNEILSNFTSKDIKVGHWHALLLENGKLYAWGKNDYGQLGLGDNVDRLTPTEVTFFTDNNLTIKNVYAGGSHNLVTTTDNKVYVWGYNGFGQLGLGNKTHQRTPVELTFFRGIPIKDIQANSATTIVLTESGEVYSFGYNGFFALGVPDTTNGFMPYVTSPSWVMVVGYGNVGNNLVDKIISGQDGTIAITKDGKYYYWGDQKYDTPQEAPQLNQLKPIEISRGTWHAIFKTKNGDIYVSGGPNHWGQLGVSYNEISKLSISTPVKLNLDFLNN